MAMADNALTPERIRDAAEVVRKLWPSNAFLHVLEAAASDLERERAVEAKREKRIDEIAEQVRIGEGAITTLPATPRHRRIARVLLDRYPSLLDEPKEP